MQNGIDNWGSLPYLERMMQFASARGQLLNDSIANIDTPGYVHKDVSPGEFQEAMRSAMEHSTQRGESPRFRDTRAIRFGEGGMELRPEPANANILFHDGNDRSLEQLMQGLSENFLSFRYAAELFRNTHQILNSAIQLRP
jgi:flagellar basal-body rod protein FlgB